MKNSPQEISHFLIGQTDLRVDYWDIHCTSFITSSNISIESVVKEFLFTMPPIMIKLMAIREFLAGLIGLKTVSGKRDIVREANSFKGNVGDKIALFEVWSRARNEILTGQRDKHLDFGLSFYIDKHNERCELKLITIVQVNNLLGRIYFLLVKPFHMLMMPIIVKRLAKRLK